MKVAAGILRKGLGYARLTGQLGGDPSSGSVNVVGFPNVDGRFRFWLSAMNDSIVIWTKSKWKRAQLDGKRVEIRWMIRDSAWMRCEQGEFLVSANRTGQLFVQIDVRYPGALWSEIILRRYQLPQKVVDRIREHPDKSVADFLIA
jgi:hypothetical protein